MFSVCFPIMNETTYNIRLKGVRFTLGWRDGSMMMMMMMMMMMILVMV